MIYTVAMSRRLFYRNAQGQDHLELFLVSAVSSLLLLRFYLSVAGYPQLGGGNLHIAHMLYGGLLMMGSIVINLAFLGIRAKRFSALIGGVGFGIFIDELGKFLTKDNNYFFRPTIGIIYALFIVMYLGFNFLTKRIKLSSEEYQLNAMRQFEEAVVHDMDRAEKAAMRDFLKKADPDNHITQGLIVLLKDVETVSMTPNWFAKLQTKISRNYQHFWKQRSSSKLVGSIFVIEAIIFVGITLLNAADNLGSIGKLLQTSDTYATKLIIGQFIASLAAGVYAIAGAVKLPTSRAAAFEFFRRATLINIFLTEFFIFSRIQFGAIPGFMLNLVLLVALRAALNQESRAKKSS